MIFAFIFVELLSLRRINRTELLCIVIVSAYLIIVSMNKLCRRISRNHYKKYNSWGYLREKERKRIFLLPTLRHAKKIREITSF